jgi:hypothetical protein
MALAGATSATAASDVQYIVAKISGEREKMQSGTEFLYLVLL